MIVDRARGSQVVQYLVVLLASVAVGTAAVGEKQLLGVAVLGVVAGGVCLMDPRLGAASLIVSAFGLEWLVLSGVAPASVKLVQDVLAVALVLAVLLKGRRGDGVAGRIPGIRWFFAFMIFAVIGWVLNPSSLASAWVGTRDIWLFGALAIVPLGLGLTERQCRSLLGLLLGLVLLQTPVAVAQFVVSPRGVSGDPVGGTLGGSTSGVLTALLIGSMTLIIGMYLHRGMRKRILLVMAVLLAVPPALNETKVFFVAAPLVWGGILLSRVRRNSAAALGALILAGLVIYMSFVSYGAVYGHRYAEGNALARVTQQELSAGESEGGVMKRVPSLVFAVVEVSGDSTSLLFGHGGGSLARSAVLGTSGTLVEQYGGLLRNTTFATAIVLEYGLLGVLSFLGLVFFVVLQGRRLEMTSREPFWKATAVGLQGLGLTMVLLSVYTDTFAADSIACAFWLLAGTVVAQIAREARVLPDAVGVGEASSRKAMG